jgi:prepilin-type N-terminal cleavage/methylation domain-containing protein
MTSSSPKKNTRGFTLIELLMVVAIISVISSITIAVLSSARNGARNADRNETARQYIIALGLYQNTYGVYPTGGCSVSANCSPSAEWVCLGNNYPGNSCFIFGAHNEDATTNDQIKQFIPGLPSPTEPVIVGNNSLFGFAYGCTDDSCAQYNMSWVLEGSADTNDCYGGAIKTDGGAATFCTFTTDRSN